jgi:hypothetical protein
LRAVVRVLRGLQVLFVLGALAFFVGSVLAGRHATDEGCGGYRKPSRYDALGCVGNDVDRVAHVALQVLYALVGVVLVIGVFIVRRFIARGPGSG